MRRYAYVGPEEIRRAVAGEPAGRAVVSVGVLAKLLGELGGYEGTPCTYVVDLQGQLRIADRHSEHVACAAGHDVLAAGEIAFEQIEGRWRVNEASNQSTGYCPEASSWAAVASALDAIGVEHGDTFTHALEFRRCVACGERNVVKDGDFSCALCGVDLPADWNFDDG